jgi:hypothetical protein
MIHPVKQKYVIFERPMIVAEVTLPNQSKNCKQQSPIIGLRVQLNGRKIIG